MFILAGDSFSWCGFCLVNGLFPDALCDTSMLPDPNLSSSFDNCFSFMFSFRIVLVCDDGMLFESEETMLGGEENILLFLSASLLLSLSATLTATG